MKKVSDYLSDNVDTLDNMKQATIAGTAVVQERVKGAVQTGLDKTQEGVGAGVDRAQSALKSIQKGSKKYSKNLRKMQKSARKNMKSLQKEAAKNLKGLQQRAGSNMQAAQKNVQQASDALQSKRAKVARRRARRKWAFRSGLVLGVGLALLYAPMPGPEMRSRVASFWQRLMQGRMASTPVNGTMAKKPDMVSSNRTR